MDRARQIAQLDREYVFVQSYATDLAAVLQDDAHGQVVGPAQTADLGERRPEAAALTVDDVAARAAKPVVVLAALPGVARDRCARSLAERADIGDELTHLVVGHAPHPRHPAIGNALADDVAQRFLIRGQQ